MQIKKENIRNKILKYARKEFIAKGFKNTSMRKISKLSGVGLSNIYNYYKSKDEIFCEVLKPLLDAFAKLSEDHNSEIYLTTDIFIMKSLHQMMLHDLLEILKNHRKELKLLLFDSAGSSLENFRDVFNERQTETGKEYLIAMKHKYPHINCNISPFFIHIMGSLWLTIIGEILMHSEISENEIETFLLEYITFTTAGWKEILNA